MGCPRIYVSPYMYFCVYVCICRVWVCSIVLCLCACVFMRVFVSVCCRSLTRHLPKNCEQMGCPSVHMYTCTRASQFFATYTNMLWHTICTTRTTCKCTLTISSVLQRVAACCSVLQVLYCVALCRIDVNNQQCVAACCSMLQRVAMCCNVLYCVALCRIAFQCVAVCCRV